MRRERRKERRERERDIMRRDRELKNVSKPQISAIVS